MFVMNTSCGIRLYSFKIFIYPQITSKIRKAVEKKLIFSLNVYFINMTLTFCKIISELLIFVSSIYRQSIKA